MYTCTHTYTHARARAKQTNKQTNKRARKHARRLSSTVWHTLIVMGNPNFWWFDDRSRIFALATPVLFKLTKPNICGLQVQWKNFTFFGANNLHFTVLASGKYFNRISAYRQEKQCDIAVHATIQDVSKGYSILCSYAYLQALYMYSTMQLCPGRPVSGTPRGDQGISRCFFLQYYEYDRATSCRHVW